MSERKAWVRKALGLLVGVSLATVALGYAANLNITAEDLTTFTSDDGPTPTASPSGSASASPSATPTPTPTTATCTLDASKDAHVNEDVGSATLNFGGATTLLLRARFQNNDRNRRIYVQFPNPSACSPAVPTSATIDSAAMTLNRTGGGTETQNVDIHRVTSSWSESTITWTAVPPGNVFAGQPTFDATASDGIVLNNTNGAKTWTVTNDVTDFHDGTLTNNGWLIKFQTEGGNGNDRRGEFSSREVATATLRPKLVITYTYTP